jgi:hypothetical protein
MFLTDLHVAGAPTRARLRFRRALTCIGATAIVALSLAACGDSADEPQTTAVAVTTSTDAPTPPSNSPGDGADGTPTAGAESQESTIEQTLHAVLVTADPEQACVALVTERFVRIAYGDEAGCRQAQSKKAAARRIEVSGVAVDSEGHGQGQVKAEGGVYDGQKLRAELILDGQTWRLDSLHSNVPVGP